MLLLLLKTIITLCQTPSLYAVPDVVYEVVPPLYLSEKYKLPAVPVLFILHIWLKLVPA